ncbi:MAG: glycerol-3-phosphate 1-O-acyltransferase PlsY [Burkholderiales bacterium]
MNYLLVALFAYLLGSVSFAVIVSRVFGLPDPRTYGSNNPGATNVLRTGNKLAAALTLIFDTLKGWLAVVIAVRAAPVLGLGNAAAALAGLSVFLGHLFPAFYQFKGGKGVATALGVLLALDWRIGCLAALIWVALFALMRISSIAALIATTTTPLISYYFRGGDQVTLVILIVALLVLWRHKENIRRLLVGREDKVGDKPNRL